MSLEKIVLGSGLVDLAQRFIKLDPQSLLTVYLHDGYVLRGKIIKVSEDSKTLLFLVGTTPPDEIAFIPFSSISHFYLINPTPSMKALVD